MRATSNAAGRLSSTHNGLQGRSGSGAGDRLSRLELSGPNPGALGAWVYIPQSHTKGAPLVVVLHGCSQTAQEYDAGSGWSAMADRYGFALLFPEQHARNNLNGCFNWFNPRDITRGMGEAASIRGMVASMAEAYDVDLARIFVTGLSAGGAMASVMLATYPEVFAGGAIIAGLPYGCATTIPQAFERMRGHGGPAPAELSALVRGASDHPGPWPIVSIWQGTADTTVNPNNADAIVEQWRSLHRVGTSPSRRDTVDGYPREVWSDEQGRDVIEEFSITGMGHGAPVDSLTADGPGKAGAYMLEASISSTYHICRFWGLTDGTPLPETEERPVLLPAGAADPVRPEAEPPIAPALHREPKAEQARPIGVGKVIEDALRAAGLMR